MTRKQTFQQRLVQWAVTANDDQLNMALDTLKAFKAARTPCAGKSPTKRTRTVTATKTAGDAGDEPSSVN